MNSVDNSALDVRKLSVRFEIFEKGILRRTKRRLSAVDDVSFSLGKKESIGIIGESGCGKSTLVQALLGLVKADYEQLDWDGVDLHTHLQRSESRFRRHVQIVFQDSLASLNPRMKVFDIVSEPIEVLCPELSSADQKKRVVEALSSAELSNDYHDRYPHELSGGQCQRVGLARALVVNPEVLICDESLSGLDVSIQAEIIALLKSLRASMGISLIFVSHDITVLHHLVNRVFVMYLGKIIETASADSICRSQRHPYTKALISSIPSVKPSKSARVQAASVRSESPSLRDIPSGCRFHPRCPFAEPDCRLHEPELKKTASGGSVACHYPL